MNINNETATEFVVIDSNHRLPDRGVDVLFYSNEYGWAEGYLGLEDKFYLSDSVNGVKGFKWLEPKILPTQKEVNEIYDSHILKYPNVQYESGLLDGIEIGSQLFLEKLNYGR